MIETLPLTDTDQGRRHAIRNNIHATASNQDNTYVGNVITITSGLGSGQSKTIVSYTGSTTFATVDSNWATVPDATSVYSVAAPTQAQQQRNYQALIKSVKYRAIGRSPKTGAPCSVWYPAMLPADGEPGQRYVVINDNATTSGVSPITDGQNANISGDFSAAPKVTVWEFRKKLAGVLGWGRVAVDGTPSFSNGVEFVMLNSTGYQNWASGGDNFNVISQTGTKYAPYVPVRSAQSLAALAESAIYNDLHSFQSELIYGPTPEAVQGSSSWHFANGDIHLNAYGHDVGARSTYQKLSTTAGVLETLLG